jgi:hypothetical protein
MDAAGTGTAAAPRMPGSTPARHAACVRHDAGQSQTGVVSRVRAPLRKALAADDYRAGDELLVSDSPGLEVVDEFEIAVGQFEDAHVGG